MLSIGVLVLLAAVGMGQGASSSSQCQVCQTANEVFCESESTFYICSGEIKHGPYTCNEDEACTNSMEICVKKTDITSPVENVCGGNSGSCNSCPADRKYSCVSRSQAAPCVSGKVSTIFTIDCGEDEVCVAEGNSFLCMPSCVVDYEKRSVPCSNAGVTTAPPTTPSIDKQKNICIDASENKKTKFFFAYADSKCTTYVYCERNSVTSKEFSMTFSGSCSAPRPYFNTVSGTCQATVPDNCKTDAPSS